MRKTWHRQASVYVPFLKTTSHEVATFQWLQQVSKTKDKQGQEKAAGEQSALGTKALGS